MSLKVVSSIVITMLDSRSSNTFSINYSFSYFLYICVYFCLPQNNLVKLCKSKVNLWMSAISKESSWYHHQRCWVKVIILLKRITETVLRHITKTITWNRITIKWTLSTRKDVYKGVRVQTPNYTRIGKTFARICRVGKTFSKLFRLFATLCVCIYKVYSNESYKNNKRFIAKDDVLLLFYHPHLFVEFRKNRPRQTWCFCLPYCYIKLLPFLMEVRQS